MTHIMKSLAILVVFLLVSVSHDTAGNDKQLQFKIGLSKQTFLMGETIWLDATLTNVSSDTVRIFGFFPPCQGPLNIELKDSIGKVMPYTGSIYEMTHNRGLILNPNEFYYGCFNLLELFNTDRGLLHDIWGKLPPGHYVVRAAYRNIPSVEQLEFEVIEPTEGETESYQILQDAFTALRQRESELRTQKLQELVAKFPNSVYAEKALRELFEEKELLQGFPNSGYTERSLRTLIDKMDSDKKKVFLQNVVKAYAGSRSAKFAQQMLKWLEE
jgi:hypothetical protein